MTNDGRNTTSAVLPDLVRLLDEQLACHRTLLQCAGAKRKAIAVADAAAVCATCEQEQSVLQRLADLEQRRQQLLAGLSASMTGGDAPGGQAVTVTDLAAIAPEPERRQLLDTASALRETMQSIRRESSIVRTATEALGQHLNGLMMTMHSALSRAGVYGRRGDLCAGAQLQSNVDLKS